MRAAFSDFSIKTDAQLSTEHPKVSTEINVYYRIKVDDADKEKVEKAVHLSGEKYCGVSAMLKKNCSINIFIEYL
jgi:Predicted redox protein, regulator of disulfide bond formation